MQVRTYAYRRTPGGSWTLLGYQDRNLPGTQSVTKIISFAYDCRKDYYTYAQGWAQNTAGGAGHNATAPSTILPHTC
jgi:hypothetical protein